MRKRILSLLVLLAMVAQGAWADGTIDCTPSDKNKVLCTDGSIYDNVSAAGAASKTPVAKIIVVDTENHKGLALALSDEGQMNYSNAVTACNNKKTSTPVTNATWAIPSKDEWEQMITAAGSYTALRDGFSGIGGTNISNASMEKYWTSTTNTDYSNQVNWTYDFSDNYHGWKSTDRGGVEVHVRLCLRFDIPIPTHNAALATGTPTGWSITPTTPEEGSTVTVSYTGQHRVKSVRVRGTPRVTAPTAVEDALTYNTTAQTLFNAGSTNLGTLKYKVTTTNTKPAITDDGWDTTIPTQTNGGTYYLWYYVDGGENNKTTEVNGTAVTKDINKAAGAISYSEASVTKEYNASAFTNTLTNTGDGTVTYSRSSGANVCTVNASSGQVTLNGSAGTCTITATVTDNYTYATTTASYTLTVTPPLASVTSAHVGYYVCTDGTYYSHSTAVPSGKTVAGMIAYVSSKGHGLIIAKTDAYNGDSGDYSTMENACRNYTPTITAGGTTLSWKLPSKTEFENMGADQDATINTRLQILNNMIIRNRTTKISVYPDG